MTDTKSPQNNSCPRKTIVVDWTNPIFKNIKEKPEEQGAIVKRLNNYCYWGLGSDKMYCEWVMQAAARDYVKRSAGSEKEFKLTAKDTCYAQFWLDHNFYNGLNRYHNAPVKHGVFSYWNLAGEDRFNIKLDSPTSIDDFLANVINAIEQSTQQGYRKLEIFFPCTSVEQYNIADSVAKEMHDFGHFEKIGYPFWDPNGNEKESSMVVLVY